MNMPMLLIPQLLVGWGGRFLILIGTLLLLSQPALAVGVSFAWDASPSPDVGGYKLYYGKSSKNYTSAINVGNRTFYKMTGLTRGTRYFFALKAYNSSSSIESGYSNEVSVNIPAAIALPRNLSPTTVNIIASTGQGVAPLSVTFTPKTTGDIKSWRWDFPGSSTPIVINKTGNIQIATYFKPGNYTIKLTVLDATGKFSSTKRNLHIGSDSTNIVSNQPSFGRSGTKILSTKAKSRRGLVAAYNFDEENGDIVRDLSGYNNDGKISEAIRIADGRVKSLQFDGLNDTVTIKHNPVLNLRKAFTLEAWIKPASVKRGSVIAKEKYNGGTYELFAFSNQNLPGAAFRSGRGIKTNVARMPLPFGKWLHMASTFDGVRQRLYVNGVKVAGHWTGKSNVLTSKGDLCVGGNSWGGYFQGIIDDVRIYDRALSGGEIRKDLITPVRQ